MKLLVVVFATLFSVAVTANIYDGQNGDPVNLDDVISTVYEGSVIIISELHGHPPHHQNQVKLLKGLNSQLSGIQIHVAMEFLDYTQQPIVNEHLNGDIDETEFLNQVNWGSPSFDYYREQFWFPTTNSLGTTLAINAPRWLTSKIAKTGKSSLNRDERKLFPPNFEEGNADYFERFKQAAGHHIPPSRLDDYFTAQSLWDDTMAWRIQQKLEDKSRQVIVVIVGDFHASYGGGLPDRLESRSVNNIVVISQVNSAGLTPDEKDALILPHPNWGTRADFVWDSH